MDDRRDHWDVNARQWGRLGAPLRPSPADVDVVARVARERGGTATAPLRALLLGVTPEIATIAWPRGTRLVAVDRSADMIRGVWPRAGVPSAAEALRANWLALPVAPGSIDVAAGDACLNSLAYPAGYRALGRELRRALATEGRAVLRVFVQPDDRESLDGVADDLHEGRIGSFHAFKLRLLMALQETAERGVRLPDAWEAWRGLFPRPDALAGRLGWPRDVFTTIDVYRDTDASYSFPTLDELRAALGEALVERTREVSGYECASRCPSLVLARR